MATHDSPDTDSKTVQSLERGFSVVDALDELHEARVSELAEHTGIPKSTLCFHLKTLQKTGHVVKEGNQYRLTLRFLEYGGNTRSRTPVFQGGQREVDKLADETGSLVDLCVRMDKKCVLLYTANGTEAIDDTLALGTTTPLGEVSPGKVIIAFSHAYGVAIPSLGSERALGELEQITEKGIHVTNGRWREGLKTITFPILDEELSEVYGALSVSGTITERSLESVIDRLELTANTIQYKLRYQPMYAAHHRVP